MPELWSSAAFLAASRSALATGAWPEAIDLAGEAIRRAPAEAAGWTAAGLALQAGGRLGEARGALCRAALLDPGCAVTRNALALALQAKGQLTDAASAYAEAMRLAPRWFVPRLNLGLLQQRLGDHAAALPLFVSAVALAPEESVAWQALGTGRQLRRDPRGAEQAYRRALELTPAQPDTLGNLGRALRDQGRLDEAAACYAEALALRPDHAETRWNTGILEMLRGNFAAGWDAMEWRWRVPGFPSRNRGFTQPLWSGEDIAGQRILLHAEQGFGDSIQLLRYVAMVAARGAEVVLELQPELLPVAAASGLPAQLVAQGAALPGFDWHCPLLSLPRAFGTLVDSVPAPARYLSAPEAARARWQARLPRDGGRPRLGLVWAGRPTHANDANRSIGLAALAPVLAGLPWRAASLQVGPASAEIAALRLQHRIDDLAPALTDFGETAAALEQLDLVVAVDTAVAHLAAALGRPVLLLLPFSPDWRWMTGRGDTPWYPAMRLLRQARPADWTAPLAALAEALRSTTLLAAE